MTEDQIRAFGIDEQTSYPPETAATTEAEASIEAYSGEGEVMAMAGEPPAAAATNPYPFIRGLVDVRFQLRRQSWGGPTTRRSLAQKDGGVIYHYAGPAQNRGISALARLKSYADYHCRPNGFGPSATGNGIMYHIGIAEDGTKYLLRDLEEDRWHCGSWPENGTWLAINIPIGEGQTPTEAQYRAAREVGDDWLKYKGLSRQYVKGHREVGASNCPGSIIMSGLVYPMRTGENPGGAPIPVKEQQYPLRKYNFLHLSEIPDHKQIARAATEAINAAATKAGKEKLATYAGGNPDRVRYATGKSADAKFGECVSILVGEPVTHHVHPKVSLVGKPDETDIWGSFKVYPRLGSVDAVAHFMAEISRREGLAEEALEADYRRRLGKGEAPVEPEPSGDAATIDRYFASLRPSWANVAYVAGTGRLILEEAARAGLHPAAACALVEQESAGRNVFGCDHGSVGDRPPYCHQAVTKDRVAALRNSGKMNGVGLTQLTWHTFVTDAEKLGGAHVPRNQLRIGFGLLASYLKKYGEPDGWGAYNAGEGNRASVRGTYSAACMRKRDAWKTRLSA